MVMRRFDPSSIFKRSWQPGSAKDDDKKRTASSRSALVILNQPIVTNSPDDSFDTIWHNSTYRVCADGGANRLYDSFAMTNRSNDDPHGMEHSTSDFRENYIPTTIIGDMDSSRQHVRQYYRDRGTKIVKDDDQYHPDVRKSINHAIFEFPKNDASLRTTSSVSIAPKSADKEPPSPTSKPSDVVVLGSLSGRVDHAFSILSELFSQSRRHTDITFWLVSEASVSFVLPPGTSEIAGLQTSRTGGSPYFTINVGILPAFGPAVISLRGFEWDVDQWPTEIGGNVSSSNHVVKDVVAVTTDVYVLFTVERWMGRNREGNI